MNTASPTYFEALNQYRRLAGLRETAGLLWGIAGYKIGLKPGPEGMRRMQNWKFFQRLLPHRSLTPLTVDTTEFVIRFRPPASENEAARMALRVPFRDSSDSLVFDQVFMRQDYFQALEWFANAASGNPIRTVMDVGANIGCTAIFLATLFPDAEIFCLEPEAGNFAQLQLNVRLNPGRKIRTFRGALSTRAGKLRLSGAFKAGNDWGAQFVGHSESGDEGAAGQQVDAIEISELADKAGFDEVDFFKMDIEGAEAGLLRDPRFKSFLAAKVQRIAIEVHEEFIKIAEARAILESLNFKTGLVAEFLCGVKTEAGPDTPASPAGPAGQGKPTTNKPA